MSDRYGYPTTRRFSRSMREAWPREHASPVEHYRNPGSIRGWMLAIAAGVAFALTVLTHL